MEYQDFCACCNCDITITGAYIGSYDTCYCEDCGWECELCDGICPERLEAMRDA